MKKIFVLLFFVFSSCSFDNKSGIWENKNEPKSKVIDKFKDFKTIYAKEKPFNKLIKAPLNLKIQLDKEKTSTMWSDEFYSNSNTLDNFIYKDTGKLVLKSQKLSRYNLQEKLLFDGTNLISSDDKGNVIVYSTTKRKIIYKFNFYKKNYKNFEKKLSIILDNEILYVADNFGYVYSIDYKEKKIIWAKYFKIPFRSNLKISKDKLFLSDQNNTLYVLDKLSGKKLKLIPTEEVTLKSKFINSIALKDNSLIFLNTFGTIYAINVNNLKINWFINLNQSLDLSFNNLFTSNPILIKGEQIIVATDLYLYILDLKTGTTILRKPINSSIKPISTKNGLYLITEDNLLIYLSKKTKKILYSISIDDAIANFLDSKKKKVTLKTFYIVNKKLYIFLENSYLIKLSLNGKILEIKKFSQKLGTLPIFINESIFYLNKKNNLVILN